MKQIIKGLTLNIFSNLLLWIDYVYMLIVFEVWEHKMIFIVMIAWYNLHVYVSKHGVLRNWFISLYISQEKGINALNLRPSQPVPLTITSGSSSCFLGDTTMAYSIWVADGLFIISSHSVCSQELGFLLIRRSRLLLVSMWAIIPAKMGEYFSITDWLLGFLQNKQNAKIEINAFHDKQWMLFNWKCVGIKKVL